MRIEDILYLPAHRLTGHVQTADVSLRRIEIRAELRSDLGAEVMQERR